MSNPRAAVVHCISTKTCFINLPESWNYDVKSEKIFVFQIEYGDKQSAYVSWSGDFSSSKNSRGTDVVDLNSVFAQKLNIKDGDEVIITEVNCVPSCDQVWVEPVSCDDWEILELNLELVQSGLLSQTRVVWEGQIMPVFLKSTLCIFLRVNRLSSFARVGILERLTEIHIIPKPRDGMSSDAQSLQSGTDSSLSSVSVSSSVRATVNVSNVDSGIIVSESAEVIEPSVTCQQPLGRTGDLPISIREVQTERADDDEEDNQPKTPTGFEVSLPTQSLFGFVCSMVSRFLIPDMSGFQKDASLSSDGSPQKTDLLDSNRSEGLSSNEPPPLKFNVNLRVHPLPDFDCDVDKISDGGNAGALVVRKTKVLKLITRDGTRNFHRTYFTPHDRYMEILCNQPTTLFTLSESLPLPAMERNGSIDPDIPSVFTCKLTKIPSPEELQDLLNKKMAAASTANLRKMGSTDTVSTINKSTKDLDEAKRSFDEAKRSLACSAFVKVVVVDKLDFLEDLRISSTHKSYKQVLLRYLQPGCVLVPEMLRLHLGLEIASKVYIEADDFDTMVPSTVVIHPLFETTENLSAKVFVDSLQDFLTCASDSSCPLVASHGTVLQLHINEIQRLVLLTYPQPNSVNRTAVHMSMPDMRGHIVIGPRISKQSLPKGTLLPVSSVAVIDLPSPGVRSTALGAVDEILPEGIDFLKVSLNLGQLAARFTSVGSVATGIHGGGLLIVGPQGSGRTTIAGTLCRELGQTPYYVFTEAVDCKCLRGKRPEAIHKIWKKAFSQAVHKAPSVVLLDNLDQVAASNNNNDSGSSNAAYCEQVANTLLNLLCFEVPSSVPVVVLATSISKTTLHPSLVAPRGRHIFQTVMTIPTLDQEKRIKILKALAYQKSHIDTESVNNVDFKKISSMLEGSIANDLKILVDKAVYTACARSGCLESHFSLSTDDFLVNLTDFTPTILEGFRKPTGDGKGWNDVGGLSQVKNTLQEVLLWPTKFPALFAQCPLRLCSGILLYGPPGTGKTLLAAAVAKECNLHFISIKGPELLSKYIGASEQAVRDLFQRANSATPCILFFDEFDSIAPKRGHDSTGVTDRVVNQLLTQLDGVEERPGVYVLAATSRPDLIDPALLRPGRLDKCLHCPLPTREERLEILSVLSKSIALAPDVDLDEVMLWCEDFSGADLQALLYNAQLSAVHRLQSGLADLDVNSPKLEESSSWLHMPSLEAGVDKNLSPDKRKIIESEIDVITTHALGPVGDNEMNPTTSSTDLGPKKYKGTEVLQADLLKAAQEMKPSVSGDERLRYWTIYEGFVKSRGGDFTSNLPTVGKRTTLA